MRLDEIIILLYILYLLLNFHKLKLNSFSFDINTKVWTEEVADACVFIGTEIAHYCHLNLLEMVKLKMM